jgi:hypothetical protein
MTIEEMRSKLTEMLIESDYGSVMIAKKINISYMAFNRFIVGVKRTNIRTLLKIEKFLNAPPPRKPSVRKDGKRRMERINIEVD